MAAVAHELDIATIRADFPTLAHPMNGRRLVYLDSAATSQRPEPVLAAMDAYHREFNAPVHRGAYTIAAQATEAMESARHRLARFIGAPRAHEVIFTKNATESLNLVAQAWGRANLGPGDAVVLTHLEHHANIVPWQMIAAEKGFEIRWIPLTPEGHLDLTDLDRLLDGARMVSFSAMSNVLGTLTPVRRIVDAAHAAGALTCVDGSQYVPHLPTDVTALGCDFFAFTGHKMLGPTGIGVLWGREDLLEAMPPFIGGGNMIAKVTLDGFTCAELPAKFEAGTPPIAEAIGLGAAVDYLTTLGMDNVRAHEVSLTAYALRTLTEAFGPDITIHGPSEPAERGGVISFALDMVHPHDVSQVLDGHGVCVRAGHHCAKPLMQVLGVPATSRASVYVYNDEADVDVLVEGVAEARSMFAL